METRPRVGSTRRLRCAVLILAGGALGGCLGSPPGPEPTLYVISIPAPVPRGGPGGGVLAIDGFEGAPALETDRLLIEESPYRVDSYPYHRWTAPPRRLIAEACGTYLEGTGLFRRVTHSGITADWRLRGFVRHFGQVVRDGRWWGHVALGFELVATKTRRVVWSGEFERSLPAKRRHPEAVVEALSRALGEILEEASARIREARAQGFVDSDEQGT